MGNPCPIRFNTGITYDEAKTQSERLATFIQTVTIHHGIYGFHLSSTNIALEGKLKAAYIAGTFDDRPFCYIPVICMVASAGGSGKDTFIEMASTHISSKYRTKSASTVDVVKTVCDVLTGTLRDAYNNAVPDGMNPIIPADVIRKEKNEKYRQLLHDIKDAWTRFDDGPVLWCLSKLISMIEYNVNQGSKSDSDKPYGILFVNNRDLDTYITMKEWCYQMGVPCIGIKVDGVIQASDYTNTCDANVDNIPYDIVVSNKGTLQELDDKAAIFTDLFNIAIHWYGQEIKPNTNWLDYFTPFPGTLL